MRVCGVEAVYKYLMRESACDVPDNGRLVCPILFEILLVVHLLLREDQMETKNSAK